MKHHFRTRARYTQEFFHVSCFIIAQTPFVDADFRVKHDVSS